MRRHAELRQTAARATALNWPEYLMEAGELAAFMVSACVVVALLEHPQSAAAAWLPHPLARRAVIGAAMGLTAIAIVYSPWGRRSGAHFNPAVTLTFWWLGKIADRDAAAYVAAHFAGAWFGVALAAVLLGEVIGHPSVNYVATVPGPDGVALAFAAEAMLSFGLMSVVLRASNSGRLAPYTGLLAGVMVAVYIAVEAPLSGMSMNPARSFGPALFGRVWSSLWLYFTAPPLGMLAAAAFYLRQHGAAAVDCAKLHHRNRARCIFCEYQHRGMVIGNR
jgi:aquaporin Z